MTTHPAHPEPDRDVLISRVVEGRARGEDWQALRRLAEHDSAVWAELALSQDQASHLAQGLEAALAEASAVALPHRTLSLVGHDSLSPAGRGVNSRLRAALPWALAATLGLAFGSQYWFKPVQPTGTMQTGGLLPVAAAPALSTPEEAMQAYLDLGRQQGTVVGELPERRVIESRPAPGGEGYEVLFIRQVLERAVVKDLYRTGTDDRGRTVLLPASVPTPVEAPPL